jgi:hypothetical protein
MKKLFIVLSVLVLAGFTAGAETLSGNENNADGSNSFPADLKISTSASGMVHVQLLPRVGQPCTPRFGSGKFQAGTANSLIPQLYRAALLPIINGCGENGHSTEALLWINLNADGSVGRAKLVENSNSKSKHTFWTNF